MFPRKEIKSNARAALKANYWPVVGYPFLLGLLLVFILSIFEVFIMVALFGAVGLASLATMSPESLPLTAGGAGVAFLLYIILMLVIVFGVNVIAVGELRFHYKFYSGDTADFGTFFDGFKNGQMWHVVGGMFLMSLYLFLWTFVPTFVGAIILSVGIVMGSAGLIFVGSLLYIAGLAIMFVKAYQYSMLPYLLLDRPDFTVKDCFAMTKKMTAGNKWSLFVLDLSFIGWEFLSLFTLGLLTIFYVGPYMNLASAGAYDYLKRVHMPEAVPNNGAADFETSEVQDNDIFEE